MKSIAEQLRNIITQRAEGLSLSAAPVIAEDIRSRMLENTLMGRGFGNDEYNNQYSQQYARSAKGGQISPVTLRHKDLALETAHVVPDTNKASIAFKSKGAIFKYHHNGTARGGKTRSIFPKTEQSVPTETKQLAYAEVRRVLNG